MLRRSSTVVGNQDRVLTAQDLQDAVDLTQARGGQAPQFIIDQKALDTYKDMFKAHLYPKFKRGDWVFDGEQLYQVVGQQGNRVDVARMGDFRNGGILGVIDVDKLQQVPKGATLETVKVLFGKTK